MTYAGARGDTEKSMAKALNFTLTQERLHPAFNSLDLQLKQRGQGAKGYKPPAPEAKMLETLTL